MAALDGLRGLAVAAVVAFHLGYLEGGYLGVDLFFVLSGYLITGILLGGDGPGAPGRLAAFWMRRSRRILPAQLALLLGAAAFGFVVADAAADAELRADALAAALGVANWHDLRSADSYWDLFRAPSPLAHLWSLSIELQLYLLWPLVVRSVARRRGATGVAAAAGALAAVSAGWAITLHAGGASSDRIYLGTDTRASALLLGAALAGLEAARSERGEDRTLWIPGVSAAVAVGVLVLQWGSMAGQDETLYQGGLLLHSAAAAVVVAVAAGPRRRWLHPILELRPLVALGVISYGVYLWHWLVIVWADEARTGLDGAPLVVVQLGLTLLASLASWVLVERPLRRGVVEDRWLPVAVPAVVLVVLLVVGAATLGATAAPTTALERDDIPADGRPMALVVGDSLGVSLVRELWRQDPARDVRIASAVYPGCTLVSEGTMQLLADGPEPAVGCGPFTGAAAAVEDGLERYEPREVVVLFALPDLPEHQLGDRLAHACTEGGGSERTQQLEALVPDDRSIRVTLLTTPLPGLRRTGVLAGSAIGIGPDEVQRRIECHNDALRSVAAASGGQVRVLALDEQVCATRPCPTDDAVARPDGVHLDGEALVAIASWLLDALEEPIEPAAP